MTNFISFFFLHLCYHLFERCDLSHVWIYRTCMRINKSKNMKKAMAPHKKSFLSSISALSSLILFSFLVFSFRLVVFISCMWIRVLTNRHFSRKTRVKLENRSIRFFIKFNGAFEFEFFVNHLLIISCLDAVIN